VNRESIIAIVCLALTIILYSTLGTIEDERAEIFPRIVILIMIGLSALLLLQSLIPKKSLEKEEAQEGESYPLGRFILLFAMIVIYFAFMETLGFYLSAFIFYIAVCFILGRAELTPMKGLKWVVSSGVFVGVLFILFSIVLEVQTPRGIFY
jgi:hypothetical protein